MEYPDDPALRAIGRVAVIGVLLRLRTPVMAVEQFRNELDAALDRASGGPSATSGTLRVVASWDDDGVEVEVAGPASTERLHRPRIRR